MALTVQEHFMSLASIEKEDIRAAISVWFSPK
jgi:hypothetical protein